MNKHADQTQTLIKCERDTPQQEAAEGGGHIYFGFSWIFYFRFIYFDK